MTTILGAFQAVRKLFASFGSYNSTTYPGPFMECWEPENKNR